MKTKFTYLKYIMPVLAITMVSCSVQSSSDTNSQSSTSLTTVSSNTKIEPKTTSGQTFIGLKNGDSNLILNLKLTSKGNFTGDGVPAFVTKAESSSSQTQSNGKLDKITSEISVNNDQFKFDIPSSQLTDNQHKINLTGLKQGDVISFDGKAYDEKGNIVGAESLKNKKVEKDIESFDINISLNINISVNVSQNVVVNQSQTGPTININLPSPPPMPTPAPSKSTSSQTQAGSGGKCVPAGPPDHTALLSDGTKIKICTLESGPSEKCYKLDENSSVKLEDGRTIEICQPK